MIIVYAVNKDGDGYVQKVGEWDSIEDMKIRVGMYADDVLLEFEYREDIE